MLIVMLCSVIFNKLVTPLIRGFDEESFSRKNLHILRFMLLGK